MPTNTPTSVTRTTIRRSEPRSIVIVDNYDSFTYNLAQYLAMAGARCEVIAHDAIDVAGLRARAPSGVVLGPGPCSPDDAGVTLAVARELSSEVPVLGVCLGHQAIGQAFGGVIVRAYAPVHGEASPIFHDGTGLFEGLASPFHAGRYHSLVVERCSLPSVLRVTASTAEGEVMAFAHRERPVHGIQFHPESFLTESGLALLGNWLALMP